ncbi:sulfatase family protein [Pedobacter miscanthi]|uniref:Heparan N-sulfatase n=1 Tax=Pedobacter miscanthi TaxID=2259170 RepID=A0A366L483_9SPHI|nr:sulfatase [Pedobacter miscanthi]RBQ07952.1 heparan N-sulfatase [Pedobacter miscanthi]
MKNYLFIIPQLMIYLSLQAQQRPNILFAIMDDATYQHMGAYGCKWVKTPNFDRIAKNGLLFKNAYTPNAKCAPSRSCIITGRNSWQLEEAGNHWSYFPAKFISFAEILAQNGYQVGYTGKGIAPVVAKKADGSPREMLVKAYNKIKTTPATAQISNVDYAANFEQFLNNNGDKPFFFWYGGLEPHRGYEFNSGVSKGNKKLTDIPDTDIYRFWPKKDSVRTDLLDYAFEIEYFDKHLGKMLKMLEEKNELHNTLIVVTSDNGMAFPRIKGQAYEYSNHLPLAMMWADGITHKGRKIEDFISFIDFAPTFLELAKVHPAQNLMKSITGKSFTAIFNSGKEKVFSKRNFVLVGKERHDVGRPNDVGYPIRGIFEDQFLFIKNFEVDRWPAGDPITGYLNVDGGPTKTLCLNTVYANDNDFNYWLWSFGKRPAEELYDIKKDPACLNNLAMVSSYKNKSAQLKNKLFTLLKAQHDPRVSGRGADFDKYLYADKKGVNFYNRYMAKDTTLSWGWVNDSDFQDISKIERAKKARNQ